MVRLLSFSDDFFGGDLRETEEVCRRDRAESETQRLSCWILMGIMLRRYVLEKND
jgi:hypothetical protein